MGDLTPVATETAAERAAAHLLSLGLSDEALEVLRGQGFIASEYRTRHGRRWGPFHKLRWRQGGRQRVLYLGRDEARLRETRHALKQWQQAARIEREVAALLKQTRRALGSLKQALAPHVEAGGRSLHGYSVRRSRQTRREQSSPTDRPLDAAPQDAAPMKRNSATTF